MTLIAAYSYAPNTTVFVSDFRTTFKSAPFHSDNAFKFRRIHESAGLFLAGNVNGWNAILNKESARLNKMMVKNYLEELRELLLEYSLSPNPIIENYQHLYALGIVLNKTDRTNKIFYIDYCQGVGVIVDELEKNKVYLLGSGADIKGLREYLDKKMLNYTSNPSIPQRMKEPYLIADIFEKNLSVYLENSKEQSIYEKKGISNVFAYGYAKDYYFEICSYSQTKFNRSKEIKKQEFSFEKNHNDEIVLKDISNNTFSELLSIGEIDYKNPRIIIDPFNRENS